MSKPIIRLNNIYKKYFEGKENELEQGMIVRASANEDEAKINSFDEEGTEQQEGFDFGGFGGGMPSGGTPSTGGRPSRGFSGGPGGFN